MLSSWQFDQIPIQIVYGDARLAALCTFLSIWDLFSGQKIKFILLYCKYALY